MSTTRHFDSGWRRRRSPAAVAEVAGALRRLAVASTAQSFAQTRDAFTAAALSVLLAYPDIGRVPIMPKLSHRLVSIFYESYASSAVRHDAGHFVVAPRR